MNDINVLRTMSAVMSRVRSMGAGLFGGKRDLYSALGYTNEVTTDNLRHRYERGDIAGRIVDAYPKATWGGESEIIEIEDPEVLTPFEVACSELLTQTKAWSVFKRADILASLGSYSVILIGAPGMDLSQPLERGKPGQILYLTPYGETTAKVSKYDDIESSPRYGCPTEYELISLSATGTATKSLGRKVHFTRCLHIADNFLENELCSNPRLVRVWNKLDDLDKVVGGGSEAWWKTVFQGMQLDIDKDMQLDDPGLTELKEQIDEFEHNMRRTMRTRGVNVKMLGAETSDFAANAGALLDLISGSVEIPQRILLGSERGELASTQDRENWHDAVSNRRLEWAGPYVVHPFIDRLIEYGYLPRPADDYWVVWSRLGISLDTRSVIAERLSKVNTNMGETVVTGADIRDKVLVWDQLTADELPDPATENDDPALDRSDEDDTDDEDEDDAENEDDSDDDDDK